MFHRLTALVLAVIMASPACWCGWTHAAATQHVRTCCAAKAKAKGDAPAKSKDCPCAQALKVRDVVQAKVKVPVPMPLDSFLMRPAMVELQAAEPITVFAAYVPPANGPPRMPRPLYYMDCSLLI